MHKQWNSDCSLKPSIAFNYKNFEINISAKLNLMWFKMRANLFSILQSFIAPILLNQKTEQA